jgi:hypothetical protein
MVPDANANLKGFFALVSEGYCLGMFGVDKNKPRVQKMYSGLFYCS